MNGWLDLLSPSFLLRDALRASLAVGLLLPAVGAWFTVRRMTLLGVALPQISAAGVALAFFLSGLGVEAAGHEHDHGEHGLAVLGALGFTYAALGAFALLERRRDGLRESRLGAAYAAASAAALLLVANAADGRIELLGLLNGEIVSVAPRDLRLLAGVFAALAAAFVVLHRQFLLVAFDPDAALVMGKRVTLWELAFHAAAGTAVAVSVLVVGPLLTFGCLVLPSLAARPWAKHMGAYLVLSSTTGALCALAGFRASYAWDWPLGPTIVAVSAVALVVLHAAAAARSLMLK